MSTATERDDSSGLLFQSPAFFGRDNGSALSPIKCLSCMSLYVLDKTVWMEQLHGTGFSINSTGYFVTASHVLKKGEIDIQENGGQLCILPTQAIDVKAVTLAYPIFAMEHALLIAIFLSFGASWSQCLRLGSEMLRCGEVATLGYPMSVAHKTAEEYRVRQRGHRGYIQQMDSCRGGRVRKS